MEKKRRIAVIGAGPAGYTAAKELLQAGFAVDLFDKEKEIGGAVYTGIPDFRMPKTFLQKEYDTLKELGAGLYLSEPVDREKFTELQKEHDGILCAIGAQVENTFGFETGSGLEAGLTLLYDLNILHKAEAYGGYRKALVWGGGNVAMDCARSLIRLVPEVTVVYRRSEKEMPASAKEINDAKKEGVQFAFLTNIREIVRDEAGRVKAAQVIRMRLGEPDESGRASFHEIPGSEEIMPADLIIMAIGQKVDFTPLAEDLSIAAGHETNISHVWTAGDAWTGPKTIGAAVQDGRAAAKEIIAAFEKEDESHA
ncbi:MAG: FAD-dependent oxidoreductase [Solobacterium sp.]|nr:FAD-dependent oxidoreductase [Solobacterium sp.]